MLSFSSRGSGFWGPYCVENDRRCSDGGRADDRLSHGALLFIDDEATVMRTPAKSGSLGDEDEPTKVLDRDRATRKSIEDAGTPPPTRKK